MKNASLRRSVATVVYAALLAQPALAAQQYHIKIPVQGLATQTQGVGSLSVSPASMSFGSVLGVGSSASAQSVAVTNIGNAPVQNLTAAIPSGGAFSIQSNDCPAALSAGATCNIAVGFTPSAIGEASAQLAVSSNAQNGLQLVTLRGSAEEGVSKAVLTTAPTLTLADWYQSGSAMGTFSYRNDGSAAMTLASPALTVPLSVSANTCNNVAIGGSCTITVALNLESNGGSSSQSFTPSGAGVSPATGTVNWSIYTIAPRWSAGSLIWGTTTVGTSSTQTITLTNEGSVAANWAANNGVENLPEDFTMDTSACGNVVPGGNCLVRVTFAPKTVKLYVSGEINMVTRSYAREGFTVGGRGGAAAPKAEISAPTSLPHDTESDTTTSASYSYYVSAGSEFVVTLKNAGGGELAVQSSHANIDGTWQATCSSTASLAANQTCTWRMRVPAGTGYDSFMGSMWFEVNGKYYTYTIFSR